MQVLDKDTIKKEIEQYLSVGKRGFKVQVPIYQIVELILFKNRLPVVHNSGKAIYFRQRLFLLIGISPL